MTADEMGVVDRLDHRSLHTPDVGDETLRIPCDGVTRGGRDGRDRRGDERDAGVAVDAPFVDRTHAAGPFDALGIIIVATHVPPAGTERQTERSAD